ncbi:MAG TPA: SDR family NAD(P)-dependent oxidoreductase [Cyclobacteriaceae bacterium]|nr:SDR family NAD(P)-dependent oxidoreductase [Cyclobacteriaceae bacterium]
MARIFITGSADGLGLMAAQLLIDQGHQVVLHARNVERRQDVLKRASRAEGILTADVSSVEETKELAEKVNQLGKFDAVIHNAGVYQASAKEIFVVNTLAPYILTCLIHKPKRLIYLSSGLHTSGRLNLEHIRPNSNGVSYSDTKLHVVMLTLAIARQWPEVFCNAVNPGWVPTKMGGKGAPDDLQKGCETQAWLAVSDDDEALVSGRYFFHRSERNHNPIADDVLLQEKLLTQLEETTGITFPR